MRPVLKVGKVLDLHDARYCAAVGIGMIGFQLNELKAEQVAEILDWTSGPEGIAEFHAEEPATINAMMAASKCTYAGLGPGYPVELTLAISTPVILKPTGGWEEHWASCLPWLQTKDDIYLETPTWSTEEALGWIESHPEWASRILLSCDDPNAVEQALRKSGLSVKGYNIGSLVKEPDGHIDYERCDALVGTYFG